MATKNEDQQFVESIVQSIVNNPGDVKTERTVDEMGVLITLHINPADMGQVIGRQGQTAKSIRTLLRVVGAKNQARVNLKIYEPEKMRGHDGRDNRDSRHQGGSNHNQQPSSDDVDLSAVDLNI